MKRRPRRAFSLVLAGLLFTITPTAAFAREPVKIAYFGDQGMSAEAKAVLKLVKTEGAHLVMHQVDLDYVYSPKLWDKMITAELGESFPYLAVVGNHDALRWGSYQKQLAKRLERTPEVSCTGDLGINSTCVFKDITFVLSGIGTKGDGHEEYLAKALEGAQTAWKVCSWHKNQRKMQVGGKKDETGWRVYETCREHGAMIATGHEHSYSRTHLLSNFENQTVSSTESTLRLEPGKSFAFVNGLGGREARDQELDGDWWAAVYAKNQGAQPGVLFCEYFVDGVDDKANCYFKNIAGDIIDEFALVNKP